MDNKPRYNCTVKTSKKTDETPEAKSFIAWVKEHKEELLFAGISITTVLLTLLGLKNKAAINELWGLLKERIEKGALYSDKWFSKASLTELEAAREIIQTDYRNPNLDMDYRDACWHLLKRFDNAIRNIKYPDKETGFPVHSDNGWYLLSDD